MWKRRTKEQINEILMVNYGGRIVTTSAGAGWRSTGTFYCYDCEQWFTQSLENLTQRKHRTRCLCGYAKGKHSCLPAWETDERVPPQRADVQSEGQEGGV